MDDRDWVTTPLPASSADALALLASAGVEVGPPIIGSTRHCVGSVDVEDTTLGAVALVDIDGSGTAWLQAAAGDESRLAGLPDTLRAAGARRLLATEPVSTADAGEWRRLAADPPLWALEL